MEDVKDWPVVQQLHYLSGTALFVIFISVLSLLLMRRRGYQKSQNLTLRTTFWWLFAVAICSGAWGTIFEVNKRIPFDEASIAILSTIVAIGTATAILLLANARQFTKHYGHTWVKGLDFIYLAFGSVGILRVLHSSATEPIANIDTISLALLAAAISVRLSRTIIEVFFDSWIEKALLSPYAPDVGAHPSPPLIANQ